jgi:hypothetical protein
MKLYAQHGYAKGDKLNRAFESDLLDGVILGPNNERPESLRDCIEQLSQLASKPDILVDPQFYVSLLKNPKEGNLPLYESYYESNVTLRDLTPKRIEKVVRNVLDFQRELEVTKLLSPTIILDSLSSRSAAIADFMAQASMEYHAGFKSPQPLLLSFVFNEMALSSQDQVNEFLDMVSLYSASGFYLVVARQLGSYQQTFDPERMAAWLLILYSLGARNKFDLICGYTDFLGFPASAVGVSAISTGWFNSLRQFGVNRFLPSSGGRPPKERYSSGPLLNSIFLQELDSCFDADKIADVLTGTRYDRNFRTDRPSADDWPPERSTLHHWSTLRKLFRKTSEGKVRERIEIVEENIENAQSVYRELRRRNVQFDPSTNGAHLTEWADAIKAFRESVRL